MGFLNKSVACFVLLTYALAVSAEPQLEVVPNEYVVELTEQYVDAVSEGQGFSTSAATVARQVSVIKNLGRSAALVGPSIAPEAPQGRISSSAAEAENTLLSPNDDNFCNQLIKSGAAKSCSPNFIYKISAVTNDPQSGSQWAWQGMDAYNGWDVATDAGDVVVAVIDTGVDYTHPDLVQNMWVNSAEIPNNGIDDDGNGYIDDIHGINARTRTGNPMDDNGHGTHVAGTIGARGNNGIGVVGVSWNVKLMALKFLAADGSGSLADAILAFNYLIDMKNRGVNVRISSNSWGGGGYSQALADVIAHAGSVGIAVVAAAGNEANDNDINPQYPSSFQSSNVISVAAIDQSNNIANFSNYGATTVDIAAPGVGILSTYRGGTYATLSGTSMATPHVSGALALLLSREPSLTPEQMLSRLMLTGSANAAVLGITASGRSLNLNRMLRGIEEPLAGNPQAACNYNATTIAFNPDTAVDSTSVVSQGDEFSYHSVRLPFAFPFYGTSVSRISVSPNGVIYMGNTPEGLDYQNGTRAPKNSFAALQTDLVAEGSGYGVRVLSRSDRVTISWLTRHFSYRSGAPVRIWVTLYPSGKIDQFVSFGGQDVESAVRSSATVGISGNEPYSSYTYAFNSPLIVSGMALRFDSDCKRDTSSKIRKVDIRAVSQRNSTRSSYIRPGSKIKVTVSGSPDGVVGVTARLDSFRCPNVKNVNLSKGKGSFTGRVPNNLSAKTLKVSAGRASSKASFSSVRTISRAKRISRSKQLSRACNSLLGR